MAQKEIGLEQLLREYLSKGKDGALEELSGYQQQTNKRKEKDTTTNTKRGGETLHEVMSVDEMPREKLIAHGAKALTNTELLAIILRSGTQNANVITLSGQLLKENQDSLYTLYERSEELIHNPPLKGLGPAKMVTLAAALELGIRVSQDKAERDSKRQRIECSGDIYKIMHPFLFGLKHEEVWLITIAASGYVTHTIRISTGGINEATADIKMILRNVILRSAPTMALVHNHPGGSTRPSMQDNELTRRLYKATKIMGINFIDHLIFTDNSYYSYADHGEIL